MVQQERLVRSVGHVLRTVILGALAAAFYSLATTGSLSSFGMTLAFGTLGLGLLFEYFIVQPYFEDAKRSPVDELDEEKLSETVAEEVMERMFETNSSPIQDLDSDSITGSKTEGGEVEGPHDRVEDTISKPTETTETTERS